MESEQVEDEARTVVWFSAGAASAVAAKLTLLDTPSAVIAYVDTGSEHPDNERFLADCEEWFGVEIMRLKSHRHKDIWDVFEKERYLNGPSGAKCTVELKKKVRFRFERPTDRQIFGYTSEEAKRADRFREQNPRVDLITPLIDRELTKTDCLAIIDRAGIDIPAMYLLGYNNNNCIGCVRGGMGYWNKIRVDFPEIFERMSEVEVTLGRSILRDGNGDQVPLRTLDPERGRGLKEPSFECSIMCSAAEDEIDDE